MGLDIEKIADDLGLPRDKFRAGVQRIQREQEAVAHFQEVCGEYSQVGGQYASDPDVFPLFRFPPATPSAVPDGWIDQVVRDVAELPDRSSPEDWPEAMLVTADELRQILESAAPAPAGETTSEVLCEKCGQPTMHTGNVCYGCAHPAPAGEKGEQ